LATAESMRAAAEKAPTGESFGQKLTQAIKAKLRSRSRHSKTATNDGEKSFGQMLTRAVKARAASRSRSYLRRQSA
jgi:flagellar hook-basal body complex protein FliE